MMSGKYLHVLIFFFLFVPVSTHAWPVPDTGQTKCYDTDGNEINPCPSSGQAFYGQDASYTINPMSYNKLDAAGNDLPDGAGIWSMVRDNITGLIWEVKTDDGSIRDKDNTYTWYDSNPATNGGNAGTPGDGTDTEDFINALNDTNYGGYHDWRIPTNKELSSIVNYSLGCRPTISVSYFPNTAVPYYWSSTTLAPYNDYAWGVYFDDDKYSDMGISKSDSLFVRAVRGGQPGALDDFIIHGDGTVTDTSTGLMWQQITLQWQPNTAWPFKWQEALNYCENLKLANYDDWRLPTVKELRSLVDYSRQYPAINPLVFPDTEISYWSSTTFANDTKKAWFIDFNNGGSGGCGKGGYDYVRAVRGGQPEQVLSVIPLTRNVENNAGSTAFSVSNTGIGTMPWTAAVTSGSNWLSITSGSTGSNSGTITCAFDANINTSMRIGTIRVTATGATVSPVDLTVRQASIRDIQAMPWIPLLLLSE